MTFTQTFSERVALRCDATPAIGVGHVMRSLALAEELRLREVDVLLWGRIAGLDWLRELVEASRVPIVPAAATVAGQVRQAADGDLTVVGLDGYHLEASLGTALRASGPAVLALVDGDFGAHQQADLYVDQNLGARPHHGGPTGSTYLVGPEYVLLRDAVLRHRRAHPGVDRIRSVLAVFGGSDAAGAAPRVVPALLATGAPVEVTVVSADPDPVRRACCGQLEREQQLHVIPPQPELARLAASADLVISASGTTVWELLAIGVPTAAVCVVDNQEFGYRALLDAGVVTGLGRLTDFDTAEATRRLRRLIENPQLATAPATRGQQLIDGRGRARVIDALFRTPRLATHRSAGDAPAGRPPGSNPP